MAKLRIGVLASTNGTNLQALIDDLKLDNSLYEIVCVVSNVYDAGALDKARIAQIPTVYLDPSGKKRTEYDEKLVQVLKRYNVELVCLIGYMKLLTSSFVKAFPDRIINVHPSLIPAYAGKGYFGMIVHESVIADGCKVSGMTIHLVNEELDGGKILVQKTCEINKTDTVETLKNKVQSLEKEWYPKVVKEYARARNFNMF